MERVNEASSSLGQENESGIIEPSSGPWPEVVEMTEADWAAERAEKSKEAKAATNCAIELARTAFNGLSWRQIAETEQWKALRSDVKFKSIVDALKGEAKKASEFAASSVHPRIKRHIEKIWDVKPGTSKYHKLFVDLSDIVFKSPDDPTEEFVEKVASDWHRRLLVEQRARVYKYDKWLSEDHKVTKREFDLAGKRRSEISESKKATKEEISEMEACRRVREKFHRELNERRQMAEAMGGYGAQKAIESKPDDWLWMAKSNGGGQVYFMKSDPHREYSGTVMNQRIHKRYWEPERDSGDKEIWRNNKIVQVQPSLSHLSRPDWEVKKLARNPFEGTSFIDGDGELCLNQWRPFKIPPRPAEKYFEVGKIVEDWLELLYPGRASWVMDVWAHAYQKLTEKANFGIVFGGGQGVGKDTLLSIATHSFAKQSKVANIRVNHMKGGVFEEFLIDPIVILGEFHTFKGDQVEFANTIKSYTAAPPDEFMVNMKHKPLTRVANIHRIYITTNHEDRFPRENDDRRMMILKAHISKERVREFITERLGAGVMLKNWIEAGAGDAFTHIMLERDISKFDPYNLPAHLMEAYDEVKKGFDVEPVIVMALDEAAERFGSSEPFMGPPPEDGVRWPRFISSQQIYSCHAAINKSIDGEQMRDIARSRGHLDVLMKTAGYQPVMRPRRADGKEIVQWRGNIPTNPSGQRVQTTAIYIRSDSIEPTDTVPKMQAAAKEFVKALSKYWDCSDPLKMCGFVKETGF